MSAAFQEIEQRLSELSMDERLQLIDRLTQSIRQPTRLPDGWAADLADMARDPDIQREIHEIDQEFSIALEDGLDPP